ncbi:hypothetical protein NDN08_007486 [Rhodosorus marinus]|uniref:Branchpoint-bridging protein n=1 Tax=Rhodosorus marinus TaxID=101924 RepID=A0AAV8V1T0_9RHOD|nr:hypothetical protein NDN08_007486 [Rhodosorus marinus]
MVGTIPHNYGGAGDRGGGGGGGSGGGGGMLYGSDVSSGTAAALSALGQPGGAGGIAGYDPGSVPIAGNVGVEMKTEEAPKRRRKSRWSSNQPGESDNAAEEAAGKKRKSRFSAEDQTSAEELQLRQRLEELTRIINENKIPVDDLCRSPSPEPIYDARGKRINMRKDRARAKLEAERHALCDRLKELDPNFRPPSGMLPQKYSDKLYLPVKEFPNTNFIGLILGPRGNTHKKLERDYEVRVAIRGKGSVKDGRARGPPAPDDNDDLHVVVSGEGPKAREKIKECIVKIKDLIKPLDDDDNEHKQAQLRELAALNGTLRDRHLLEEERRRFDQGGLKCRICGDGSHPTNDCPMKNSEQKKDGEKGGDLDDEYLSFVAEIGGGNSAASNPNPGAPRPAAPNPGTPKEGVNGPPAADNERRDYGENRGDDRRRGPPHRDSGGHQHGGYGRMGRRGNNQNYNMGYDMQQGYGQQAQGYGDANGWQAYMQQNPYGYGYGMDPNQWGAYGAYGGGYQMGYAPAPPTDGAPPPPPPPPPTGEQPPPPPPPPADGGPPPPADGGPPPPPPPPPPN